MPHGALTGLLLQPVTFSQTLGVLGQSLRTLVNDTVGVTDDNARQGRHLLSEAVKMEIAHWVAITVAAIAVIIMFVGAAYQERFEKAQAELDANLRSE